MLRNFYLGAFSVFGSRFFILFFKIKRAPPSPERKTQHPIFFFLNFIENYKLSTANRYPLIPNPERTASVYIAVTDF